MSDVQHTPGPWSPVRWPKEEWSAPSREDNLTSACRLISTPTGEAIAIAVTCYPQWSNERKDAELAANAHLIAAAPDLLKALQKLVSGRFTYFKGNAVGHDIPLTREDIEAARVAIAKALGAPTA